MLLGRLLVMGQVAASLLLLIGAGLFVRSLQRLMSVDLGFTRENVLLMRVEPRGSDQKSVALAGSYSQLLGRIEALAGVRSASMAGFLPITAGDVTASVTAPDGSGVRPSTSFRSIHTTSIRWAFLF